MNLGFNIILEESMLRKKVLLIGVALMLVVSSLAVYGEEWDVSTASGWAQGEITEAYENGLMPERLINTKMTQNISRADFAALVVKLYEEMTGVSVEVAPASSFTDTKDVDVLKAKALGIMQGDNGLASPDDLVTRQGMAVMYHRTMKKVSEKLGTTMMKPDGVLEFKDKDKVASWAIEAVDYVYENKIMTGDEGNFSPLNNAPVEQSVIVVKRLYKDNESSVVKKDKAIPAEVKSNVDISKGFKAELDPDNFGSYLKVVLSADGTVIEKKPEPDFSFSILDTDMENGIVYLTQTHDMAIDERGVVTYKYDIRKDQMVNMDKQLDAKISNVMMIKEGTYKNYIVLSMAGGHYWLYDSGLKKIAELEAGATQENVNGMIKNKLDSNGKEKEAADKESNFVSLHHGEVANAYTYDIIKEPAVRPGVYDVIGDNKIGLSDQGVQAKEYVELAQNVSAPKMIVAHKSSDGQVLPKQLGSKTHVEVEVEMSIVEQGEHGNAGIVFDVSKEGYGTDNYYGLYFGIDLKEQTYITGYSENSWLGFAGTPLYEPIDFGEKFTLKMRKEGMVITYFINNRQVIAGYRDFPLDDSHYGVRAYDAKSRVYKITCENVKVED